MCQSHQKHIMRFAVFLFYGVISGMGHYLLCDWQPILIRASELFLQVGALIRETSNRGLHSPLTSDWSETCLINSSWPGAISLVAFSITKENRGICDVYVDGLMPERYNSIANALELRLSCTSPSICVTKEMRTVIHDAYMYM